MKVFATFLALLLSLSLVTGAPAASAKKNGSGTAARTTEKAVSASSGKSAAGKPADKKPVVNDSLWLEASAAHTSGNASDATRLLRLCRLARVNLDEVENLLKTYIGKEISAVVNGRSFSQLSEKELLDFLALQNEICSFKSSSAEDWRQLIEVARAFKGNQQFIVAGEALLDRINAGMPIKPDDQWVKVFKDLEKLMTSNTQVLYRLQLFRILAGIDATAAEYRPQVENMTILARANAARIIGKADVAMALGDLEAAAGLLEKVREFDAQYPDLERAFQRLKRAGEIQRLTGLVAAAMRDRLYLEAKRLCGEIQKIDKNNAFARNTIQQIDEISSRGPVARQESAEDRILLAIRKFETELRKAEQEQDILQVRAILKELLLLKSDNPVWVERLAAVENEIAVSALNADENFKQATRLFNEERFAELGLFLNRNPGLMNSIDTMVQVWEMRLMANYHSGSFTAAQLRESAEAIIGRAGQSFFASFVLMKLELADNRIAEARVHYQNAVKINPKYPGLRWPGWLLWAHGEGRWAVVLMLIVVLVILIQLLRPAMALYESTYWLRVGLLARVFPSLALRSLEKCFGIYRDGGDRVKLFRLLVRCCNATGDKKKAMMYAGNLHELVPGDPLVRAMGFAASPAADESQAGASDAGHAEPHAPDVSHGKLLKARSDSEATHRPAAGPAGAISLGAIKSRRKSEEPAVGSDETADAGVAPAEEPAVYDENGFADGQSQYADSYGYDQAAPDYDGAVAPEAGGFSQEPGSQEQWPENAYEQTAYENEQYQQPQYHEDAQPAVQTGEDGYPGHDSGYEQQGYEPYSEAPAGETWAQGEEYPQQSSAEAAGGVPDGFSEQQNYNGEYAQPEQYDDASEVSEEFVSEAREEHVPGAALNTEAEDSPTAAAFDQADYEDEPAAASENLFNDLFVSPPRRRAEPAEPSGVSDSERIAEPAASSESAEDWSLSSVEENSGAEYVPGSAPLAYDSPEPEAAVVSSSEETSETASETASEELQPIAYTEEYSHEDFPEEAVGEQTLAGEDTETTESTDAELQPIAYTEDYSRTDFPETAEPPAATVKDKLDYDEFEPVIPKYCCNKDLPANEITISPDEVSLDEVRELLVEKPAETAVIDLDAEPVAPVPAVGDEILAADESAPVFNIEDSIRETRNSLFAELDATNPPAEPSQKWREALRQPIDADDLFKDL